MSKYPEYCGAAIFYMTKMSILLSLLFKRENLPVTYQSNLFDIAVKFLYEMRLFE